MASVTVLLPGIFIGFICLGAGRKSLRAFGFEGTALEEASLGLGLGLGFLAYGVLALGLFHFLTPFFLWALLAVMGLYALDLRYLRNPFSWEKNSIAGIGVYEWLYGGLTVISLAAALCGVLAPETSNDSLCYHMNLPKKFLQAGRIFAPVYDINGAFPLFMEMLFTFGLGIGSPEIAKFLHFLTGLAAAGGVAGLAARMGVARHGRWAALLFLTTPGILNQMGTTYVDVGLACFTVLGLLACFRAIGAGDEGLERKWLILAGIFGGLALSLKFLALIGILAFCFLLTVEIWLKHKNPVTVMKSLLFFLFPAGILSIFWYARSFWVWGNPVYPYFYQIFKSGDPTIHYSDIGLPHNLISFLIAPFSMTFQPTKFEGFGDQIGPAYLALVPLAFMKPRWTIFRPLILWCIVSYALWFLLGQSLRFFFPVLPVLAVLVAWGMAEADSQKGIYRHFSRLLLLGILFVHTGLGVFHFRKEFKVAAGLVSKETYLQTVERSYGISRWVNRHLPQSKILAADETHLFYFDPPIVREVSFALQTGYARKIKSAEELFTLLKREGFTHILFSTPIPPSRTSPALPAMSLPVMLAQRQNEIAPYVESIYTTHFNSSSSQVQYTVYKII